MIRKRDAMSFEDFVSWLAEASETTGSATLDPGSTLLDAGRTAWQEMQSLQRTQRESLAAEIRAGTHEEIVEIVAAADAESSRWLPRLRTANGFAISALYASDARLGSAPVGLLVECPVELTAVCRGHKVHVAASGKWIELGEFDVDGKVIGDLPPAFEFKPPFGFRVGELFEEPTAAPDADDSE